MVLILGMYQTAELYSGVLGCCILHLIGCNILPVRNQFELPSTLFLITSVVLFNYLRVNTMKPLNHLGRLAIELFGFYLFCQLTLVIIWEPFWLAMETLRDVMMSTKAALHLLGTKSQLYLSMRHDLFYLTKLTVGFIITYKSIIFTNSWEYVVSQKRSYAYFPSKDCNEDLKMKEPNEGNKRSLMAEKMKYPPHLANYVKFDNDRGSRSTSRRRPRRRAVSTKRN